MPTVSQSHVTLSHMAVMYSCPHIFGHVMYLRKVCLDIDSLICLIFSCSTCLLFTGVFNKCCLLVTSSDNSNNICKHASFSTTKQISCMNNSQWKNFLSTQATYSTNTMCIPMPDYWFTFYVLFLDTYKMYITDTSKHPLCLFITYLFSWSFHILNCLF